MRSPVMSAFSAEWLARREPADAAARAEKLVTPFAGRARRIVDLAAGTGANIRWLAPRLGGPQDWLAVDNDPALLAALARRPFSEGVRVRTVTLDLAHRLDELPLDGCDLVTASALLDLASDAWLQRLASRCAAAGAPVLFALTYDGRIEWSPVEPGDDRVRELVNRHQLGEKGFGPALGPAAAQTAVEHLARLGYTVEEARSDWRLDPGTLALQSALVDGWMGAALELAPGERGALEDWARRRRALIAAGASRLRVGHTDVAGRLNA
jgi:SAM-dependent methyltransferase